jgi:hypothetical protein
LIVELADQESEDVLLLTAVLFSIFHFDVDIFSILATDHNSSLGKFLNLKTNIQGLESP